MKLLKYVKSIKDVQKIQNIRKELIHTKSINEEKWLREGSWNM